MRSGRVSLGLWLVLLGLAVLLAMLGGWAGRATAVAPAAPGGADRPAGGPKPLDILLALDNSGSMKQNDPQRLMPQAVSGFATRLAPGSRLGILLFDDKVQVVLGLTPVEAADFQEQVATSLKRVDYRGRLTDIPGGVERALYDLRQQGRPEAERLIVFMTDGLVDLGNPAKDAERARWLRETLAQEAKRLGIRMFGIAFTEGADFQLIQAVAETTGGEYYRVLSAPDIPGTFERIAARLQEAPRQATAPATAPQPASAPTVVVQTPPWQQPWALVALALVVLGIVALVVTRRPKETTADVAVPPATLHDLGQHTGQSQHVLTKRVTHLGRGSANDIVIPQETVSAAHAEIIFRDGGFYLKDRRSANGTFVNGKQMSHPDEEREVLLKSRDKIRLDAYEFEFVIDALQDTPLTVIGDGRTVLRPQPGGSPAPSPAAPQPAEAAPPGGGGPAKTIVKPEMCHKHQSWKATDFCPVCGHGYCKSCMTEKDGKPICGDCLTKRQQLT